MGHDFNAIGDPTNELTVAYRSMLSTRDASRILSILYFFVPFWLLKTLPFQRNRATFQAANTIRRTCRQLIRKKREVLEHNKKSVDVDILSTALTSGAFTDDHIVNQMMTFLAAGHETTATAVTWGVYLLCLNPDVQTRLRQEIRHSLPSIDNAKVCVTSESLDSLPYLHAVCNEVLRIKPPLPLTVLLMQSLFSQAPSFCYDKIPVLPERGIFESVMSCPSPTPPFPAHTGQKILCGRNLRLITPF